jgi:dihydroxy-acid dehydratase
LALVRDGDVIELDVEARRLHLEVPEAELEVRRRAWCAEPVPSAGGYAKLYIDHVNGAHEGADFDFLQGRRGAEIKRQSH